MGHLLIRGSGEIKILSHNKPPEMWVLQLRGPVWAQLSVPWKKACRSADPTPGYLRGRGGAGVWQVPAVPGEEAEAPPVQQPQELGPLARIPSGCFSSQPRRWPPGRTEGQAAGGRLCLLGVAAWQNSYWRGCTVSLRWGQEVGGPRVGSCQRKGHPSVSCSPKPCSHSESEGPGPPGASQHTVTSVCLS